MAEKLPVIIDNRGDNTVVNAQRRLLLRLCVNAERLLFTESSGVDSELDTQLHYEGRW